MRIHKTTIARDTATSTSIVLRAYRNIAIVAAVVLSLSLSSVVQAAPNNGSNGGVCPVDTAYGSMTKQECKACNGSWEVDSFGCGGGVVGTTAGCVGAILASSFFGAFACGMALWGTKRSCDGGCKQTPSSGPPQRKA